ncbi:hypothetical protein HD806DRAFT_542177 [Xylariaceae sp. AK1471]|nr:hypothetical protein HD806DRAFT_542177 [Xylariaceae sp. AK1471]
MFMLTTFTTLLVVAVARARNISILGPSEAEPPMPSPNNNHDTNPILPKGIIHTSTSTKTNSPNGEKCTRSPGRTWRADLSYGAAVWVCNCKLTYNDPVRLAELDEAQAIVYAECGEAMVGWVWSKMREKVLSIDRSHPPAREAEPRAPDTGVHGGRDPRHLIPLRLFLLAIVVIGAYTATEETGGIPFHADSEELRGPLHGELSAAGLAILLVMNRLGMMADLSHTSAPLVGGARHLLAL